MKKRVAVVIILLLILTQVQINVQPARAATWVVTVATDGAGICPGANCNLRTAIFAANITPGADVITFAIGSIGSTQTINLIAALPAITEQVTIDGWSQGGAGYGTSNVAVTPLIILNGSGAGTGVNGLNLTGGTGSIVQGLSIQNCTVAGISVGAANTRIHGNWIGLNSTGTAIASNNVGVNVGADGVIVGTNGDGTNDVAERNVISGNSNLGQIFITGSTVTIAGNYIGTTVDGLSALPSSPAGVRGVYLSNGSASNRIGTNGDGVSDTLERNIIAGNTGEGIIALTSDSNTIAGNYIGVNSAGNPLGNGSHGISLAAGSDNNIIGLDSTTVSAINAPATRNIISANAGSGILLTTTGSDAPTNTIITNNYIGTTTIGVFNATYANNIHGIDIFGADGTPPVPVTGTRIGTDGNGTNDALEGNRIIGNTVYGINMYRANSSIVRGNTISQNVVHGIFLTGTSNEIRENTISNNGINGILIESAIDSGSNVVASTGNSVTDNTLNANGINGIYNRATERATSTTGPGDGPNDNTITGNTITNSGINGILNEGSSPLIQGNTISGSRGNGIGNIPFLGSDGSPATASDDFLSRPVIGGSGQQNIFTNNCTVDFNCADIYHFDTRPQDSAATLLANNTYNSTTYPRIRQDWYGAIEVINSGAPVVSRATLNSSNGGPSYDLPGVSGPCAGLNNTILHGPTGISCTNVNTWGLFTEYIVNGAGTTVTYTPQTTLTPGAASYVFNGTDDGAADSGTAAGFTGKGILTGSLLRYQIMEVNISTADKIGVFRPSNENAFYRFGNATGPIDAAFNYALFTAGDLVVDGDWDGDGVSTLGIFRPSNGTWYLTNGATTVPAFAFGNAGDIPVVGNWDGNTTDTVGVFRPSEGRFYLRNTNSAGVADLTVRFGIATDRPVAGDWDNNGTDTVGVWRPSSRFFYLTNTASSTAPAPINFTIAFGFANDIPIAGDWNGDGRDSVGTFRPSVRTFYLRQEVNNGAFFGARFGLSTDVPLTGVWAATPAPQVPSFVPKQ